MWLQLDVLFVFVIVIRLDVAMTAEYRERSTANKTKLLVIKSLKEKSKFEDHLMAVTTTVTPRPTTINTALSSKKSGIVITHGPSTKIKNILNQNKVHDETTTTSMTTDKTSTLTAPAMNKDILEKDNNSFSTKDIKFRKEEKKEFQSEENIYDDSEDNSYITATSEGTEADNNIYPSSTSPMDLDETVTSAMSLDETLTTDLSSDEFTTAISTTESERESDENTSEVTDETQNVNESKENTDVNEEYTTIESVTTDKPTTSPFVEYSNRMFIVKKKPYKYGNGGTHTTSSPLDTITYPFVEVRIQSSKGNEKVSKGVNNKGKPQPPKIADTVSKDKSSKPTISKGVNKAKPQPSKITDMTSKDKPSIPTVSKGANNKAKLQPSKITDTASKEISPEQTRTELPSKIDNDSLKNTKDKLNRNHPNPKEFKLNEPYQYRLYEISPNDRTAHIHLDYNRPSVTIPPPSLQIYGQNQLNPILYCAFYWNLCELLKPRLADITRNVFSPNIKTFQGRPFLNSMIPSKYLNYPQSLLNYSNNLNQNINRFWPLYQNNLYRSQYY